MQYENMVDFHNESQLNPIYVLYTFFALLIWFSKFVLIFFGKLWELWWEKC